jgi:pilus assembly protein Flp/PilA
MIASFFKRLQDDTAAATAIEYGLIVSLMVIAMIAALQGVAGTTINMWQRVETKSAAAMATP